MKKILFVCTGNTCRSPLAEGIARKIFSDRLNIKTSVSSAGSSTLEGLPASALSVEAARENDVDISEHRTRLLTGTLVREADLGQGQASLLSGS